MADINIGIDIGKKGYISVLDTTQSEALTLPMPMLGSEVDYRTLFYILAPYKGQDVHVAFEKLGVIFGTSKTTAFSMGYQAGALEMLCITLHLPFTKIHAKIWQRDLFQGVTEISRHSKSGKTMTRDTKKMALLACQQLFPRQKLTFGDKATKPNEGLIDSLLIAEYSRRHF